MSTPIKREAGQEQPRPPPAPPQQQQQQRPTVDRPVIAAASAAAPPPPSQQQPQVIEPVRWKWMSVDSDLFPDVSVPVIMRGPSNEAYISVRITERTVLMRFQNELSAEAIAYGSLTSYPCTPAECDELNEINESYVDRLYGTERFDLATEKLVKWKEFMEFFAILKRTCRLRKMPPPPQTVQPNRAATNAPAIQPPTFPQFTAVNPNPALRVSSVANNSTIHATLRGASASVASPNRAAQQIPSIRTTTPPVNTTVFNPPNTNLIARPPQQEITPVVATTSSGYNVISTPNGYKVVPPSPSNLNQHHIASRSVSQPPSQSSPPPQQIQRAQAVNPHLQQLQEMQQLNHLQPRPHPMSAGGLVSNQHYPHMHPPPPSSGSPHHLIQLQHHINMQNIQKQQMIQHHLNQQQQMSQSPPSAQFFPNPNQHTAANVSVIPPPYVASPHRSAPSSPRSHSNGPPSSSSPGALNPPPFGSFPHGYMQQQQHQSPQMSQSPSMMSSPPTGNSANQSIHQIRPHSVAANIYPPGHHHQHQHHVSPSLYSFPHHPNAAAHLLHPHHAPPLLPHQISGYSPPQQQQPSSLLPPPPPPSHASIYNQATAQLQALQHQQNLNNPTPPLTPSPNPNLVVAANPASNTAEQILRILGSQQQQQQQSHNYNQYANNNRIIAPQMQPQIRTTAQSNIIAQPTTTSANNQQINTSSADEDDIIWLGDDQPTTKPTTSSTIVKKIETSAQVKSENKTVVMASNSNTSTNQQTQANTRTSTKDRGPINYLKINTVVVPFIHLEREQAVRLFELIPGSTQFVSAYQLAITGIIPHDLIDDRDRLRANFKSLKMATMAQIDEINKLTRELLAAFNPDTGPRLFLEQLDPGDKRHFHLVNVIELMLAYSSAAMFIREMSLHDTTLAKFNEQSFNFRDVLQMRGGIIQVIAPSTDGQDTSIKILPFVEVGDLLLIKDSIRNYLEELVALRQTESNADEPKINLSKLVIPMTEQTEEQRLVLRTFAEFFQLLLVYVAIPTRISYKMTLINVKPLLSLFPDRLFIICRFTEKFPIDWRASLENIKSNISSNSEGERINSNENEGEQQIATPTATTTTAAVRRSSRNERRDIEDANQMTIELTSSSSEDNNPREVAAATTNNNNQMTIELTSTSSDEDRRRENVDSSQQPPPPPMETDENKVTSTTTTLNVDVTNQQNSATTTTIISPQPVTTTTTTTTTTATSRFESSVSLSPASIDSPEPTSQFVEKSSSSPPKSKVVENTTSKSGRTFSISILHQQQKEKEKEKEKEAAKTVKIVTVERFTEDELKIRPRRRCYSAIYVCRATNTSKDFSDWFKAEKWPKAERRMLNQHQQQQVSSSEEKGEVVSSPPPCDHYLRRVLHGANPWEVQQSVVNLIQGHNRLAKMYKEKEERESVNKNKPRAASLASEPTSTEDMRPSITSTTNKETEKPRIKQPESSKPCEMNWEETGGGSEEPESKTTAVTTTTSKQRGRKRYSSQQSSSTTSTTNTKKRKRGSRRRFTMKTPKRRRASHETVSYMSRTTTAATRNNSSSESDTSSGGSLKDFIAKDDELEYETAEEDLYSSFPDDNEPDEWASTGKQAAESSKGIVVTLRRKSKNNPPPPPLKPNIACIQRDNDLYTSEDPAVDEREILKKMGIFKVAKITDKKLSVTQILAIQRQLKETSNADGSKRQFAKKATSTKTPIPTTKDTTITNNKRTVPAKKQNTSTTTTSPTTRQNQRKTSTTTTKQTSKVKSEPTTSKIGIEKPVSPQSAITISSSSSAASVKPTATTTKTKTTNSSTSLFHDEDSNSLPELAF